MEIVARRREILIKSQSRNVIINLEDIDTIQILDTSTSGEM